MKWWCCVRLSLIIVVLSGVSAASAQAVALVSFGVFITEPLEVDISTSAGVNYPNMPPNITTSYAAIPAGDLTIDYAASDASAPLEGAALTDTVTLEGGHQYLVIKTGFDEPVLVIDETQLNEEFPLPEGYNALIVVTELATDDGAASSTGAAAAHLRLMAPVGEFFGRLRYAAPAAQDLTVRVSGYFRFGVQYGDSDTSVPSQRYADEFETNGLNYDEVVAASLPNTNMVINGNAAVAGQFVPINYSTDLPVADWLAQFNRITDAPFTFNQFNNSAATGGFAAALQQCEDYMWNAWTDDAFAALAAALQEYVSGNAGAGTVVNNSVLQPATTTAQNISPTTTRGGIPLNYTAQSAQVSAGGTTLPTATHSGTPDEVIGNIILSISTTGSGVQNVINVVDSVPVSESGTPTSIDYQYAADLLTSISGPINN
jgi:hypothetical protein